MANTPALAQGIVPGSTASAPRATPQGATARGIKDNGVKGCGNCGLTSGRVKSEGGTRPGPGNGRKFNDTWSGARIGGPGGGPRRNAQ